MKINQFKIIPAKEHVEPNDKFTEAMFDMSEQDFKAIFVDGKTFNLHEANDKRHGKIISPLTGTIDASYTGELRPLTAFDRAIMAACVSERIAGNKPTTADIIYRHITGKVNNHNCKPNNALREKIMDSVRYMSALKIKLDMSTVCKWLGYNGKEPLKFKGFYPLLPCKILDDGTILLNGDTPFMIAADKKNQLIRYDILILDTLDMKNTATIIAVKNYVAHRIAEIRQHTQLTKTITFADVFEKCGLRGIDKQKAFDVRRCVESFMRHLQAKGAITHFKVVTAPMGVNGVSFVFKIDNLYFLDFSNKKISPTKCRILNSSNRASTPFLKN